MGSFSLFTLWFGAAVSLAEMMTGSLLAPLGITKGLIYILLGHLVGGLFLATAGYIGFKEKKPALLSSRFSLGRQGSYIVSVLNVIQLIGWTAIMLIQAAKALQPISSAVLGYENFNLFVVLLGLLVLIWALKMDKGIRIVNEIAVVLLMFLSLLMVYLAVGEKNPQVITATMTPGLAFELSLVMPLSWVPLISDYTMNAKSGKGSFWGSFLGYFIGSSLMYVIGLVSAYYTGATDPIASMVKLNLGVAALVVVLLATITTTFMDIYSAVLSTNNVLPKAPRHWLIVIYGVLGTVLALFFPMEQYESFLYMIGSVFAPTFTVVFVDYFLIKKDKSERLFNRLGLLSIVCGIGFYYFVQRFDLVIGSSLPTIIVTGIFYFFLRSLQERFFKQA